MNRAGVILLSSLLLLSFVVPLHSVMAEAEPATGPEQQETEGDGPENPEEQETSCLFLGNSKTFYNNLPEMYQNIVFAGTGEDIHCTSLTYGNRSEAEHGKAVKAVVRTKGDPEALESEEKPFFALGGVKDEEDFSEAVYQKYTDALLDPDGEVKVFDYIVIQLYSPELSYEMRKEGVFDILESICGPDTKVILHVPMRKFYSKSTSFTAAAVQEKLDVMSEQLCADVMKAGICSSAVIAYTGRAGTNYLLSEGADYAQRKAEADYDTYLLMDGKKVRNDLVVGDSNHPTQLGTYLYACVLYSTVYGKNAADTVPLYHAEAEESVLDIRSLKNGRNYSAENGSFKSEAVLETVADLAYKNQIENQVYPLPAPEIQAVADKGTGIKVYWDKVEGAASYRVFRRTENESEWKKLKETTGSSFLDKTPVRGVTYIYGVSCVAKKGQAESSNYVTNAKKILFIKQPVLKSAQTVKHGVKIKWKTVAGAELYMIYRKAAGSAWRKAGYSLTTQFVDQNVVSGINYTYTVRAWNRTNEKGPYDPVGIRILYLAAPRITAVYAKQKSFSLVWSRPVNKVSGYRIEYSLNSSFPEKSTKVKIVKDRKKLAKTIRNLRKRKTYYVRIRTYKKGNGVIWRSAWSNKVKVKTR